MFLPPEYFCTSVIRSSGKIAVTFIRLMIRYSFVSYQHFLSVLKISLGFMFLFYKRVLIVIGFVFETMFAFQVVSG